MRRALPVLVAALLLAPAHADPQQGSRPAPPGAPILGRAVDRNADLTAPATYAVRPPEGKLPWPHHAPHFTRAEYDGMMADLFIINNFGLYQGGDTRDSVYFHNGLDIVAVNGTPIHAVAGGTVRAIYGSAPYYLTVVVEDADQPGWAWTYTHITPEPGLNLGMFVPAGRVVGRVNFEGVDHLHLNRTFLKPGGGWNNMLFHGNVDPTPFFEFTDTEPPVFEPGFYYFINESQMMFPRGNPTRVSGEVDIVAGVRDPGEYGRGRLPRTTAGTFGNRNAPHRLHVSIASAEEPGRVLWSQTALDFADVILDHRPGFVLRDPDRVETVYAFRPSIRPVLDFNAVFSYYFLTNRPRAGAQTTIDVTDGQPSWNTLALDGAGRRLFPDGDYIVTVRAWDAKGNMGVAQDRVAVLNR